MQLKPSEYNFIYDDLGKDQVVIYNSRTGALSILQEKQYNQLTQYLSKSTEITDKDYLNSLLQCGYLLPIDVDEKFLIKRQIMLGRYSTRRLSLTITPTMACNFRCVYCFEQGHYGNKIMSEETMENLLKFIKNQTDGIEILYISWFGGEPLLAIPVIQKLSKEIIELCRLKNIKYHASIVTNGYFLTEEITQQLKDCQIQNIQVTIDGPKAIHDLRRPLVNGNGTYDTIMKNLVNSKGILPITLRINIDINNLNTTDEIMDSLKKHQLLKYVYPYLALVQSSNGAYEESKCISQETYSTYNLKFLLKNHISLRSIYPRPKGNYCTADFCNGWVIDDNGNVYKCWSDVGIEKKIIGNINSGELHITNTNAFSEYLNFDPTVVSECKNCKILPICLGGCPHNRLQGLEYCEQRRYNMKEYIIECVKAILNN